jgi:Putative binding domain, N-terminal/Bacterial pre-peptidase C-terminal domain/Viral BACON domain
MSWLKKTILKMQPFSKNIFTISLLFVAMTTGLYADTFTQQYYSDGAEHIAYVSAQPGTHTFTVNGVPYGSFNYECYYKISSSAPAWTFIAGNSSSTGWDPLWELTELNPGNIIKFVIYDVNWNVKSVPIWVIKNVTCTTTSKSVESGSGSFLIGGEANTAYAITEDASWISVSPSAGSATIAGLSWASMVTYTANTATNSRSARITIAGGSVTRFVTVTQQATPLSIVVSPVTQSISKEPGQFTMTVTANCSWVASVSNAPWITSISPSSGSGNVTLTVNYAANTAPDQRSTLIRVADTGATESKTCEVTQSGDPFITVGSSLISMGAAGGSTGDVVYANIPWSATTDASWLTVNPTSATSSNSMVTLTAAQNTIPSPRSGTVTLSGGSYNVACLITVTQSASSVFLNISDADQNFGSSGGTHNFAVSSSAEWTAAPDASWVTMTGASSGSGTGVVSYSVAQNTGTQRSTAITVSGGGITRIHTVTQDEAVGDIVTLTNGVPVSGIAGLQESTDKRYKIYVPEGATNLTIQTSGGAGDCDLYVRFGSMPTLSSFDYGPFLQGNEEIVSIPLPTAGDCYIMLHGFSDYSGVTLLANFILPGVALTLSDNDQAFTSAGGSHSFDVSANMAWTATPGASWVTITDGSSGNGNGVVSYSVAQNTGERSTTITVSGGGVTRTHTVTQDVPLSLTLSDPSQSFTSAGGNHSFSVSANVAWTAIPDASWVTMTGASSGSGTGVVSYSVAQNTGAQRSTMISVSGDGITRIHTVTQDEALGDGVVTLTNGVPVSGIAGLQESTDKRYKIFVPEGSTNLTIQTSGGAGDCDLYVKFGSMPTTSSYDYRPYVQGNEEIVSIPLPTAGDWYIMLHGFSEYSGVTLLADFSLPPSTLTLSDYDQAFPSAGGSHSFDVSANMAWTAIPGASWVTITDGSSGNGNGVVSYSVAQNTGERSTTITVSGDGVTRTHTVTQDAPPSLTLSDSSQPFISAGGNHSFGVSANVAWTAIPGASWVTIVGGSSGNGSGTVSYSVAQNMGGQRSTTIRVSGGGVTRTHTVTQDASPTLTLSDYDQAFTSAGGNHSFGVSANVAWTAVPGASWVTITSGSSGSGNGTVSYSVDQNTDVQRSTTITVSGGDVTRTHTVTQVAVPGDGVNVLQNGVTVTGIAGVQGSTNNQYKITVPSGVRSLTIQTMGGVGDSDLYVKYGSMPTTGSWDRRSYSEGGDDAVVIPSPAAGVWFITLHGYTDFSGLTLRANYVLSEDQALTSVAVFDGYLYAPVAFGEYQEDGLVGKLNVRLSTLDGKLAAKAILKEGAISFKGSLWTEVDADGTRVAVLNSTTGETLELNMSQNRMFGSIHGGRLGSEILSIDGSRNRFVNSMDVEAQEILNKFKGYYTAVLCSRSSHDNVIQGELNVAPKGDGYLTMVVGSGGKVKIAGMLADGTRVSQSSVLLQFEADEDAYVPFFQTLYSKKGWIGGLLKIDDTTRELSCVNTLYWEKPGSGPDGFTALIDVSGGIYNPVPILYSSYVFGVSIDWALVNYFDPGGIELPEFRPEEVMPVMVTGTSMSMPRGVGPTKVIENGRTWYEYGVDNPSMYTITFSPKTGLFKGKFVFYYDYYDMRGIYQHNIVKVPYAGVMLADPATGMLYYGGGHALFQSTDPELKAYRVKHSFPVWLDTTQ